MFLRQIKRIVHDDFSVCLLNTKSFYNGLKLEEKFNATFLKAGLYLYDV